MCDNYEQKLLQEIMSRNYYRYISSREKCGIYRDTGVSKNRIFWGVLKVLSVQNILRKTCFNLMFRYNFIPIL